MPGRRLGVPDVRLDAARAPAPRSSRADEHRPAERARLDRVAERRARAVRLVQRQLVGGACRVGERRDEQALLRLPVGRRQARRAPVLPHRAAQHRERRARIALPPRSATAPHASPRAYPSARASKVCDRPRADVMPAIAKLVADAGREHQRHPRHQAAVHSASCSARSAAWHAASAAEHAVSYERTARAARARTRAAARDRRRRAGRGVHAAARRRRGEHLRKLGAREAEEDARSGCR